MDYIRKKCGYTSPLPEKHHIVREQQPYYGVSTDEPSNMLSWAYLLPLCRFLALYFRMLNYFNSISERKNHSKVEKTPIFEEKTNYFSVLFVSETQPTSHVHQCEIRRHRNADISRKAEANKSNVLSRVFARGEKT